LNCILVFCYDTQTKKTEHSNTMKKHFSIILLVAFFCAGYANAGDQRRQGPPPKPTLWQRMTDPNARAYHREMTARAEAANRARHEAATRAQYSQRQQQSHQRVATPNIDALAARGLCQHGNPERSCVACCSPQHPCEPQRQQFTQAPARPCPPQIVNLPHQQCPPVIVRQPPPIPAQVYVEQQRYCPPAPAPVYHTAQTQVRTQQNCYTSQSHAAAAFTGYRTEQLPNGMIRVHYGNAAPPQAPPGTRYVSSGQQRTQHGNCSTFAYGNSGGVQPSLAVANTGQVPSTGTFASTATQPKFVDRPW